MRAANPIFAQGKTTVFETMTRLAQETGAVNLGQGAPDGGYPMDVVDKAAEALRTGTNQYPPLAGLPALRQAIAAHEARFYGIDRDWSRETLVTVGATEALAASFLAFIEPGDEAVLIEPFYDQYLPMLRRAGAKVKFVTLRPPDWRLDPGALKAAFGPRTKLVVLNNPHNPSGAVFGREDLAVLADCVAASDALVIADEVYEHILFDGRAHIPFASLPGMRERTVKIGSAGKIFSLTGWKVGLVSADAPLLGPLTRAHQFLIFTTPPNLQEAVAYGLGKDDAFFAGLASDLQAKRDRLAGGLRALGIDVLPCQGTYFLSIDIASTGFKGEDAAFCEWLTREIGVAAIPNSAFYAAEPVASTARFCFAKDNAVLDEALRRLATIQG